MYVRFALLFGIIRSALSVPASAGSSDASPDSDSDSELICHTSDPKECYPLVFQATDEFQKVHDDQQLPPGLHVRLNIYTGEKEAKINVPGEAGDASLEGLPVEQAVVVVEPEARDDPIVPKGAPVYEAAGKIKGPQNDAKSFLDAMQLLKSSHGDGDVGFDAALQELEALAHDLYYGLKVAEDPDVVQALLCRMAHPAEAAADGFPPRDQQAAAILAASLQNNPTALDKVAKQWVRIMKHSCPGGDGKKQQQQQPLRSTFFQSIGGTLPLLTTGADTAESRLAAARRVKAKVAALDGLVKDPTIRADFLLHDGMRELLRVLVPEEAGWAAAQRRVGLFVADNFLDEDMGAATGEWPTGPALSDEQCRREEWRTAEGCWDFAVARIAKANKRDKSHWSRDLQTRLAAARKSGVKPSKHAEL